MSHKYYYIVLFCLLVSFNIKAQDAHFSQFYSAGLYLNPATAGAEPGLMAGMNFRNQWRSIVTPYITSQLTLIAPIYSGKGKKAIHHGGIGLSIYHDKAGDGNFQTLGVNINGAYNVHLSKLQTITFGIQGGFIQKSVDFGNLKWGEQFNPYVGYDATISSSETPSMNSRKLYPDVGAGVIYSFRTSKKKKALKGYAGFSTYHLNRPNESLVKSMPSTLPMLFKGHAGVVVPVSDKFSLSPNILAMTQNKVFQLNSGLYGSYEINDGKNLVLPSCLILGGWYRLEDSFIGLIGFGNKNYLFGFSYDFNSSSLRYNTQGRGAYELSLSIRQFKKNSAIDRFHTPRI